MQTKSANVWYHYWDHIKVLLQSLYVDILLLKNKRKSLNYFYAVLCHHTMWFQSRMYFVLQFILSRLFTKIMWNIKMNLQYWNIQKSLSIIVFFFCIPKSLKIFGDVFLKPGMINLNCWPLVNDSRHHISIKLFIDTK